MVCLYNGIFWPQDEVKYYKNEPWQHYAKLKEISDKMQYIIRFHLYEMPRIRESAETENRLAVA